MNNSHRLCRMLTLGAVLLAMTSAGLAKDKLPDTTTDGLVRVKKPKEADVVYLLPDIDLSGYNKLLILEPQIAFAKGWKQQINSSRTMSMRQITDDDMKKMIARGKELFGQEFIKALEKKGWQVIKEPQSDALYVRPAIINLYINAPDPDNLAGTWKKTYTDGAGQATLIVELYDSVSQAILARAMDTKSDDGSAGSWRMERTQATNENDARYAFQEWAYQLVRGLDRIKQEGTPAK